MASGGTLVLTGGFTAGKATFLAAVDTVAGSDLKFDGTASLGQPIVINNANQTLEVGALGALTMTGLDVVTNGTIKLDGGSLTDTRGHHHRHRRHADGKRPGHGRYGLSGDGIVKASGGTLELGSNLTSSTTLFDVDSGDRVGAEDRRHVDRP